MKKSYLASAVAFAAICAQAGDMDRENGIMIGERLTIRPYVSLSYTYDSNVDSSKHGTDGSQWVVNPGFDAIYLAQNWMIDAAAWYQYHAYNHYSSQLNESGYGESLKWNWANSKSDEKGWKAMFSERFEQISQDDDMSDRHGRGIGRDRKEFHADGVIQRRINEYWHGSAIGNYYLLDYDNNMQKYATLYGWKRALAGAEFGYAPTKWTDFIIHANYQWYWQDNDEDSEADYREGSRRGRPVHSDSRGWTVMGGLAGHVSEKITYRLLGGWSRFEYGDGTKDIDGFTYEGSADWQIDSTLHMLALASSYYQPSEREYGAALKVYTASLGLGKSFVKGKVNGTLDLAYRHETHEYTEYAEDDYDEDIWIFRLGLNYKINRYVGLFGRVEYQTEETSNGGARGHEWDYDRWRGTVGVRLTY
ncbi:MAG: outer membrane beta-barrel protein [Kiritimatiellae bacterium]|nr:outer membrane beta-barrel protein [Kiritimatiellia bacterium]